MLVKCSRVMLSRQCMYWPCQWGYLFGKVVAYMLGKREVQGSVWPAGKVSHCYTNNTTPSTISGPVWETCRSQKYWVSSHSVTCLYLPIPYFICLLGHTLNGQCSHLPRQTAEAARLSFFWIGRYSHV